MKKLFCMMLVLAVVLSMTGAALADKLDDIKASGVLEVAISPDFAPMEFVDSTKEGQDQYVGFDVSLAKFIADYIGVDLHISPMSFDACQSAVYFNSVDMSISGYSWTESRAENFNLSDYYYTDDDTSAQVILIRADDAEKYTAAEDFSGLEVGAQNASLQEILVTEQLPDATLHHVGDIGVGVMELQNGIIEGLAVAEGNAQAIIVNNPDLVICDWQFVVDEAYEANVILLNKDEDALLAVVNEALAIAKENGYYSGWYKEAKELAGTEAALEVTIEDEGAEEAVEETEDEAAE